MDLAPNPKMGASGWAEDRVGTTAGQPSNPVLVRAEPQQGSEVSVAREEPARRCGSAAPPAVRRAVLIGYDLATWVLAFLGGALLRGDSDLSSAGLPGLAIVTCVALGTQLAVGSLRQLYAGRYGVGSPDDTANVAYSFGLAGLAAFAVGVLHAAAPWAVPVIALPIALVLAVGARLAFRLHRDGRLRDEDARAARRVVVFGADETGQQILASMLTDPEHRYRPVALLDDSPSLVNRRVRGVPVRGGADDVATVATLEKADLLVVAGQRPDAPVTRRLAAAAARAGLEVRVVPPLTELLVGADPAAAPHRQDAVRAVPRSHDVARAVGRSRAKRAFDVGLCLLALPVLLPLGVAVALLVAVSGSDEVVYRARRVGHNGRVFTMYKFSGMAGAGRGPRITQAGDARITRIGRLLRATKLDELPQVVNVVKGDMSIVGPRPEDPRYLPNYTKEQLQVLLARPGMTSQAFLRFGDESAYIARAEPDDVERYYLTALMPEKLAIELDYVTHWSMRRDLAIIGRTFVGLLS